eukprot:GSMAST32.ASY1.ANO1.781.1 assembled CDS
MSEFIIDKHYYALCALVTALIQYSCFFIAYNCSFDTITDFAGSINFVVIALLTLFLGDYYYDRQVVLTGMLLAARLELAIFLLYRVVKRKKDARFDRIRENLIPFLVFWTFQIIWIYVVALPVTRINSAQPNPAICGWDYLGWTMWGIGFFVQTHSDFQKLSFRSNPANKNFACDTGFWKYSRHPNYFGEILMWTGIFLSTLPVWRIDGEKDGWITMLSPIFTIILLLFVSGVPTAEGKNLKRFYENGNSIRERYMSYRSRTPTICMFYFFFLTKNRIFF